MKTDDLGTFVSWLEKQLGLGELLPTLLAALLTLAFGLILAVLGRAITRRVIGKLASEFARWGRLHSPTRFERVQLAAGAAVYWGFLAFAAMAATEILGLPVLTNGFGQVVAYLPRVVAAVLILGFGLLGAKVVGQLMKKAASTADLPGAQRMSRAVEGVLIFASLVVAVEQLGVEISFLKSFILIFVGAVLGGAALALGLGSREVIADVLSVHFLRRQYQVGQVLRIGEVEGKISKIAETALVLETTAGQVRVPARTLSNTLSTLVTNPGHK